MSGEQVDKKLHVIGDHTSPEETLTEGTTTTTEDELFDDVDPELAADFKRLHNIIRGNERRERQLQERSRTFDMAMVVLGRLDTYIEFTLGDPKTSRARLDFEIMFAEGMRQVLNQALLIT